MTMSQAFVLRLRCWAHLSRKAKKLQDCFDSAASAFGSEVGDLLKDLTEAVYRAREGPGEDLSVVYEETLKTFRLRCQQMQSSSHEKARALAGEFLNDWGAIFAVFANPFVPLTKA